ncbi:MAG TPA: L-histidine N(alpha)-methyltransferase [Bacteriovoracaceae bacterium]|nr:L-histidine N(alpha)-methyltransferase [Bacteriovoracaceae bacterium]
MNEHFMSTANDQTMFFNEILMGLKETPKRVSPKFLYDQRGSELFGKICELQEYYITRAENKILKAYAHEMSRLIGPNSVIIEPGSGNAEKVMHLLLRLNRVKGYVPIDISGTSLSYLVKTIQQRIPKLEVTPIKQDFTKITELPQIVKNETGKKVIFIPGSTLGNLSPEEMQKLMNDYIQMCGNQVSFLVGMDLKKDPSRLQLAYDDSQGVTASFNLNLLTRLNRDFGARFNLTEFYHKAFYNEEEGRVEMHLVSKIDQTVVIKGEEISLMKGETIHTESSYKYSIDEFCSICAELRLKLRKYWKDPENMFCMYYFEKE